MAKGSAAAIGDERWSQNGYHYTKTKFGWQLTSRMMMEQKLGRALLPSERVKFANNNKRDLRPENLVLSQVKDDRAKLERRKASLADKIRELHAEIEAVDERLAELDKPISSQD